MTRRIRLVHISLAMTASRRDPRVKLMRPLLLKVCALVLTLGIVAFIVQASRLRARESDAPAAPRSSASAVVADAGAAAVPPPNDPGKYGIIGPATKADPHVMRRAVESLQPAPKGSAVAP
jgi:hypothetical protein